MRPGVITLAELRLALAAPRPRAGFVSRRVPVHGLTTHFRVNADAGGPVVVLLHGLALSHRYLMPTASPLAVDHRVYLPDLPGFGRSGKPRSTFDVGQHADHVAGWLDALGLSGVCLVGHSFGTEVATEVAARYPSAVSALVLAGPTSDPAARTRRAQIGRWLLDASREDPRQAAILVPDYAVAGPRRALATIGHSVRNAIDVTLSQVDVPVLLVRGARDPIVPADWLRTAAAIARRASLVEVPRAAHNVMTTAGPETASLIRAFLASTTPAGTAGRIEGSP